MDAVVILVCLIIVSGVAFLLTEMALRAQKYRWLKQYGVQVDARVTQIKWGKDRSRIGEYTPLENHYYIICAQWRHPQTQRVYKFYSERLLELPKKYSPGSLLNVVIDPDNPERYYIVV